jgi:hypothetical protein
VISVDCIDFNGRVGFCISCVLIVILLSDFVTARFDFLSWDLWFSQP